MQAAENQGKAGAPEAQASPAKAPIPDEARREFHLKEWEALKAEVTSQIDHTRKLELATVGGLAAFYAWFVTKDPSRYVLVVPCLLVLLGALRSWGTLVRIQEIATYLRTLEAAFSLETDGLIGWDRTRDVRFPKSSPFKVSAALFWGAALLVSLAAWCFL